MSLSDLKIPQVDIEVPGGMIAVRGLSLNDIVILVTRNGEVFKSLFQDFLNGTDGNPLLTGKNILSDLASKKPHLFGEIIALSAGEFNTQAIENASRLTLDVQLRVLEEVGKLTFREEGSIKKVIETVSRIMGSLTTSVNQLSNSMIGSTE